MKLLLFIQICLFLERQEKEEEFSGRYTEHPTEYPFMTNFDTCETI